MLVAETIARIRHEFFVKGKSIKEIVRYLKVSRNTVRKVLRSGATAFALCRWGRNPENVRTGSRGNIGPVPHCPEAFSPRHLSRTSR